MRQFLPILLVAIMTFATMTGLPGSLGDGSGSGDQIGVYERPVDSGDLTENHVEYVQAGLGITGPLFTTTLRVDKSFVDSQLGESWSSSMAFSNDGGNLVFNGRSVILSPLQIGMEPVFTIGGRDQVEFQDRPMWVSVNQEEYGETLILEMEDGDTSGQEIFIAKDWLWARGIHRPAVVHEDGTELPAIPTQQQDGWVIDMHHFTYVEISPTELVVFSRQESLVVPHSDKVRWYEGEDKLEVDVGGDCASHVLRQCTDIDQDIFVEKDWLDLRIEHLALQEHVWVVEEHDFTGTGGTDYYKVGLTAAQTPTTVVFKEFELTTISSYTRGNPDSVALWASSNGLVNDYVPMKIWWTESSEPELNVEISHQAMLLIDDEWLTQIGVQEPHFLLDHKPVDYSPLINNTGWLIKLDISSAIQVLDGDRESHQRVEALGQHGIVVLEGEFHDPLLGFPAVIPWLEDLPYPTLRVTLNLCEIPSGCPADVQSIELTYDGQSMPTEWITPNAWDISGGWNQSSLPIFNVSMDFTGGNSGLTPEDITNGLVGLRYYSDTCPNGCTTELPPLGGYSAPYDRGDQSAIPIPPLPEFDINPSTLFVMHSDASDGPVALNPLIIHFLTPIVQGDNYPLRFSIDFLLGYGEPAGNTAELEIIEDGITIYAISAQKEPWRNHISFDDVPAYLQAEYWIGIGDAASQIKVFDESVFDESPSSTNCNYYNTYFTREWHDYDNGALGRNTIDHDAGPRDLGGGGHTYLWHYWASGCPERTAFAEFGFNFRGYNEMRPGHPYVLTFSGSFEGDRTAQTHPHNSNWWQGHVMKLYTPRLFYVTPTDNEGVVLQGINHIGADVYGRARYGQSCGNVAIDVLAKAAIVGISRWYPLVGIALDGVKDHVCHITNWDQITSHRGDSGMGVKIPAMRSSKHHEHVSGEIKTVYQETMSERPVEFRGSHRFDTSMSACYDCSIAWEYNRGHYVSVKPWFAVTEPED